MQRHAFLAFLTFSTSACMVSDVRIDCTEPSPLCDGLGDEYIKPPELNENPWASEITITRVSVLQGTTVDVMRKGDLVDDNLAAIYPGRDALVRVYFETGDGWEDRDISAQILAPPVDGDDVPVVLSSLKVAMGGGVSAEDALTSTINFTLDADDIVEGMELAIELREWSKNYGPGAIAAPDAKGVGPRYPVSASTYEIWDTAKPTSKLRIALVPVEYNADGSGRLPDTSEVQVELWKKYFMAQYPITEIEIRVTDPTPWAQVVSPGNTSSWSSLLGHIGALRSSIEVDNDEYLYGVFAPQDNASGWAGIAGLSNVAGPNSPSSRSSIGLGWSGKMSVETALHEVGHAHGRSHAPGCGAGGPDAGYPVADGTLGVFGYDILEDVLLEPDTTYDFMSYCNPTWPSDYTFQALYQRVRVVNETARMVGDYDVAYWEQYFLHPDGTLTYVQPVNVDPADDNLVQVTVIDEHGDEQIITGSFSPFSHAEGGSLIVPTLQLPPQLIELDQGAWTSAL